MKKLIKIQLCTFSHTPMHLVHSQSLLHLKHHSWHLYIYPEPPPSQGVYHWKTAPWDRIRGGIRADLRSWKASGFKTGPPDLTSSVSWLLPLVSCHTFRYVAAAAVAEAGDGAVEVRAPRPSRMVRCGGIVVLLRASRRHTSARHSLTS